MNLPQAHTGLRFGDFLVDLRTGELRKNSTRIHLQEKPLLVLAALAERPGELVSRAELHKRLWPDATFVDFEVGLNTAVKKLRAALCDDADQPRYIQTVPRRGYLFLVPVEFDRVNGGAATAEVDAVAPSPPLDQQFTRLPVPAAVTSTPSNVGRRRYWLVAGVVIVALAGAAAWFGFHRRAMAFHPRDSVLVADFENETGDPRFDDALTTAFTVSFAQSRYANVFPRLRMASALKRMGRSGNERVTVALGREICLRESVRGLLAGTITRTGRQYEITTQLIDPGTEAIVRAYYARAYGEDQILDALGSIGGRVRTDLGESLDQIQTSNRPLPQVTTSSLTALKQYAEANSLWTHNKYKEAVSLYRSAIELDPDFAMAHAALGRSYCSYLFNQIDLCRKEYETAQALSSRLTEREKMILSAHAALDLGKVDQARGSYRAFLAQYPDDWGMLRDYAHLLRLHGQPGEAIEQHKRILALAPDDSATWIEMATAETSLRRYADAVQAYGRAMQLDPNWLTAGNVSREYGTALIGNGEEPKAVAEFSSLLENPGLRAQGLRSLAMLDLYHGRYQSARGRLQEALQLEEDSHNAFAAARVHYWLAVVAAGQGDRSLRMEELDKSAALLKDVGPKLIWGALLGLEYLRAGALSKAERLDAFISPLAHPYDSEEQNYVSLLQAAIAAEKGQTEKATRQLSGLADPASGDYICTIAIENLAHAYQRAGNLDQAVAQYEKFSSPINSWLFTEQQQRWADARYMLASDYLKLDQPDKARATLSVLSDLWKDGDANLPLRKAILQLQSQLVH